VSMGYWPRENLPRIYTNEDVDEKTQKEANDLFLDFLQAAVQTIDDGKSHFRHDWVPDVMGKAFFSMTVELIQLRAKVAELEIKSRKKPKPVNKKRGKC
jgi:hypothetical protein